MGPSSLRRVRTIIYTRSSNNISVHSRNAAIAPTRNRLDEARVFSGVPQYFAQPVDDSLESQIVVNKCIVRPEAPSKFFACDNLVRMFQQQLPHLEGLPDEFEQHAGLAQLSCLEVKLKHPELKDAELATRLFHPPTVEN